MDKLVVNGGKELYGYVPISGMKNSALPIIFACLLVKGDCIIDNVPRVSDVENALEILRSMGAVAEFCSKNTIIVNTTNATPNIKAIDLICEMRASSYLMGAMISRFGYASIPMPGGCDFGTRPIDLHIKGFEKLGATCSLNGEKIEINALNSLKCNKIHLDKISVGATINMVLSSVFIEGVTVIEGCAKEPHVDDLICFLNSCGARIKRQNNSIICQGVNVLHGTRYTVFPDMIEALTYICFVGACKGKIEIVNVEPLHLLNELEIFYKMGFSIDVFSNRLIVEARSIKGISTVTAPYPMFPTDLHPQFAALLCFAKGGGSIREEIFPSRFAYVSELKRMGAHIDKIGNSVYVRCSRLVGCPVAATDLRAGASLLTASLGANGESTIENVKYIVRGYENIVTKLANIGAEIKMIKE